MLFRSYDKQFIQSIEEFKQEEYFQELGQKEQIECFNTIDRCEGRTRQFSLKRLEKELTGFLRTSMFRESIEESARKYKVNGLEDAYTWTLQKLNEIKQATFIDDKTILSFDNPELWIKQHELRRSDAISTGCKNLDVALGGGLFRKETCAILAPSNAGKTTTLITISRNAIINGKKVLFLIHEGRPEEIRMRILASVLCIPTGWIGEWINDYRRKYIKAASDVINRYLKLVPHIKTGAMFVEDVVDLIKRIQEDEIELTGSGFDLIVDDYPKKLKSRLRSGTKEGLYRVETAEIYDTFNHLATELDAHCLVAAQTNRTGLKINSGKIESDKLLSMEEMDESFGIVQNMANIITLNRGPEDRKSNILRLNISKSRNSETEVAVITRTDFACVLTFADQDVIKGDHQKHLKYGFLASYYQEDNSRLQTSDINNKLMQIEDPDTKIELSEVKKEEKITNG